VPSIYGGAAFLRSRSVGAISGALPQVLSASAEARVALMEIPDDHRDAPRLSVRQIAADAIVVSVASLVLDAVFRLPRARLRSCPRCGWLFLTDLRPS